MGYLKYGGASSPCTHRGSHHTDHVGMHVIERTEVHPCRPRCAEGKLTLFDAEGPRERGALKHVALRVNDLDSALAQLRTTSWSSGERDGVLDLGDDVRSGSSRRRPRPTTTSTTSRSSPPTRTRRQRGTATMASTRRSRDPARHASRSPAPSSSSTKATRGPRAAAAQPPGGARRLGRGPPESGRGSGHRGPGLRRRAEHARRVRLAPGARPTRVRRAQADVRAPVVASLQVMLPRFWLASTKPEVAPDEPRLGSLGEEEVGAGAA